MIAGPSSPGVGAPVYQPAGKPPGGTAMVPSACRPSAISSESTPIAGICTRTGSERASGVAPIQVGFAGEAGGAGARVSTTVGCAAGGAGAPVLAPGLAPVVAPGPPAVTMAPTTASRRAARPDRRLAFAAPHGVAQAFCLRRIPATAPMAPAAVTTRTPRSRYFPVLMPWLVLPSPVETPPVGVATTWGVAGVVGAAHTGRVMVFVSIVTVPVWASTRPWTVAPVSRVMDVRAMIVPMKSAPVPSDAELPTCQNTSQTVAPLIRLTTAPDSMMRSDPAWKIQTASASFWASSVSAPSSETCEAELYTPGTSVSPARSAAIGMVGPWPAALSYAVPRSSFAWAVGPVSAQLVPLAKVMSA